MTNIVELERSVVDMHVGSRLRASRRVANLSIEAVAQLAELEVNALDRIERGLVRPSALKLYHLCNALGMKVQDIFEGLVPSETPDGLRQRLQDTIDRSSDAELLMLALLSDFAIRA